jgi:hypothetical protein
MQMKIFLLLFSLSIFGAYGQKSLRDSTRSTLLVSINYKANFTGGDLADRWGFNNQLGLDIDYKLKSNLTIGLSGGFIFGNQLKDTTAFQSLNNSFGTITGISGEPAGVLYLMRGATGYASVGYVFNKLGNNPNSGLWVKASFGYLMHKIRIESLLDDVPQLEGDYRKGYDKLTMGFSTSQFIGYLFQSDRRLLKFYGGFEFTQGFTKNVRTYDFDIGGPDTQQKFDLIYGLKVGWILPISQRTRSLYYSN